MKKQFLIPAVALFALASGFATIETTGAFAQAANAPAAGGRAAGAIVPG